MELVNSNNGFMAWKANNTEGQGTKKVAVLWWHLDAAASHGIFFIPPTAQGHIGLPVLLRKHH